MADPIETKSPYSFTIEYRDGEQVIVKAASWLNLDDVILLQQNILELFLIENGCVANLFRPSNKKFLSHVKKLASLLPIAGSKKLGIDITKIDSLETLTEIFITESKFLDPDTNSHLPEPEIGYRPSKISRIHSINFSEVIWSARERAIESQNQEADESSPTPPALAM